MTIYSYDLPSFASFYDPWLTSMFGQKTHTAASPDVTYIFKKAVLPALNKVRTSPHGVASTEPFTILDLGTGTGRVVLGLIDALKESHADLLMTPIPSFRFVGLDHSEGMLAIARSKWAAKNNSPASHPKPALNISAEFHPGDLTSFTTTTTTSPSITPLHNACDVVILSAGTIHHLLTSSDIRAFLSQVRSALKPEGGVAVFNIFPPSTFDAKAGLHPPTRVETNQAPDNINTTEDISTVDGGSTEGGATYMYERKHVSRSYADVDEAVVHDQFELQVKKIGNGGGNGEEEIVWKGTEGWKLRRILRDELVKLIEEAGLRVLREDGDWSGEGLEESGGRVFVVSR
ncbi:hypothetical protein HK102_004715 [Quaeritorhiza haematococci]|nr:hypothetical protein HK102_004715 [Quaeritorhiza haematococci]